MKGLFLSPCEYCYYPRSATTNKHAFKQNAMKYSYNSAMKTLLLHHVCHDKIGK